MKYDISPSYQSGLSDTWDNEQTSLIGTEVTGMSLLLRSYKEICCCCSIEICLPDAVIALTPTAEILQNISLRSQ